MGAITDLFAGRRWIGWRIAMWGAAAFLLLLPAIAMRFTTEVDWTGSDFAIFGTMLLLACGTCEIGSRANANGAYRMAVCTAAAAGFLLVWVNLAVGIIGSEDNAANLMYLAVLAIPPIGALLSRGQPSAMARSLIGTASAQLLVGVIALAVRLGSSAPSYPEAIIFLSCFFAGLWLVSAFLFAQAAKAEA